MSEEQDFEALITQTLRGYGAPPELAPQLLAIAAMHELAAKESLRVRFIQNWIIFHIGEEWSAMQFSAWCKKLTQTMGALPLLQSPQEPRG